MYSIRNYGEMILDAARMDAYVRALRQAVKPGCVVLDIGTGTGIFALLACRFGARRVFAVEPSDAICVAQEIAAANGCAATIEFFQALSTDITLPERADVIVSDLRGILPFFGRHLAAIADARERHLVPGGAMIPAADTLWLAAVESPELYRRLDAPWSANAYGLDMGAARALAANSSSRATIRPGELAADPVACGTIDYREIRDPDFSCEVRLRAARNATAHGLCLWFDSILSEGIRLTNAPGGPGLIYGSAFFPWPKPVELQAGDAIAVNLRADLVGDAYIWSWKTRIGADRAQGVKAEFEQSEFRGEPLSPAKLRKRSARHVPLLDVDGRIDRLILELMDGERPVGDIAREVAGRFPGRFERWEDALSRVGELSLRYGR